METIYNGTPLGVESKMLSEISRAQIAPFEQLSAAEKRQLMGLKLAPQSTCFVFFASAT